MLAGSGRPRKACDLCKRQRVRCSGERPACKRCTRLRRACAYATVAPDELREATGSSFSPPAQGLSAARATSQLQRAPHHDPLTPEAAGLPPWSIPRLSAPESSILGIPSSVVAALVDVYYTHIYNSSLILHRPTFSRNLKAGTAKPALILSVCAFASVFYRDSRDNPSLRDHGFGVEWAERAGKLVFQEVETPNQDNIVIFLNLLLFWYGQGSWRRSFVHKANAVQIAHLLGLGSERRGKEGLFESELRRRLFWACFLVNCHGADSPFAIFSTKAVEHLSLPWHEDDFEACRLSQPLVSLSSGTTNGGIWCELVKAMSIWTTVYDLIKSVNVDITARMPAIHSLDARITEWWANVPDHLKLSPDVIATKDKEAIPRLLLMQVAYHQSLCALHASIVPLFSWSSNHGDEYGGLARQLSAQVAFEHACAASTLFELILDTQDASTAPSFVAYAAYCSCAIQIPFLWSSNLQLQERVRSNIRANVRMIRTLGNYWRFSALLEIYVQCLYRMHAKNPISLENEPKHLDPSTLKGFRVTALKARASVLGHNGILWIRGEGCAEQGEEVVDLGTENDNSAGVGPPGLKTTTEQDDQSITDPTSTGLWSQLQPDLSDMDGQILSPTIEINDLSATPQPDTQNTDFFYPFLEPDRFNMFVDGELDDFNLANANDAAFDLGNFDGYLTGLMNHV